MDLGSGGVAVVLTPAEAAATAVAANGAFHGGANLLNDGLQKSSNQEKTSSSDKPYENTPENQEKMKQGKAPTGNDGHPVELHHEGQTQSGTVKEMTRTEHRLGANFKKNHPNTGQNRSKINRNQAQQQKRKYWKDHANQHN